MKKGKFIMILIMILFFSSVMFAQNNLPDLVVKNIRVTNKCELLVTIANIGGAGVPPSDYKKIVIQMFVDGKTGGGMVLSVFDIHYLMTHPKRTVTKNWFPTATKSRIGDGLPHTIKVVADEGNYLREASEYNNSLTKRLSCGNDNGSTLPDLGMYGFLRIGKKKKLVKWGRTIVLTPADATLISHGKPTFELYYSYREFNRVSSGIFKNKIFFNGKLVSQQTNLRLNSFQIKHVHTQAYLGPKNGKLEIHIDADNDVAESREDNNFHFFVNIVFKDFYQDKGSSTKKLPDLIVKSIKLTNNCKIAVTVANIGKVGVPSSYYNLPKAVGVQMYVDGKPWGGLILKGFDPKGYLKKPYSQATYIWFPKASNLNLTPGTHTIKVFVDNNKNLIEAKENNNTLTKKVYCRSGNSDSSTSSTPKSFLLNLKDAYLVYEHGKRELQITSQRNVLSYGSDWQVIRMKPYLYHLREKIWKGFYWKVNTSRKEVYLIKGGSFGHYGGKETKLNISVDVVGPPSSPKRFFLRFHKTHIIYQISSKIMQIIEGNKVLSYGTDWQKCKIKPYLYDLKQNIWKGFFWRVNTNKKQVYRVTKGVFCKYGIGENHKILNIGVKIVK
jgi:hypothetical protein